MTCPAKASGAVRAKVVELHRRCERILYCKEAG